MNNSSLFFGIDGCRGGWISVQAKFPTKNHDEWNIEFFNNITDFWNQHSNAALVLIDIPIGMRDSGRISRLNDIEARNYLKNKGVSTSSIFPTPCRDALYAESYPEANKINRELTGKGLSKQSWNICPKIREVDRFLIQNNNLIDVFIESGPELCFLHFLKNKSKISSKKTQKGINERISLLSQYTQISKDNLDLNLDNFKRKNVSIDDILDAYILALSASQGRGGIQIFPQDFEKDSKGLSMKLAIPCF